MPSPSDDDDFEPHRPASSSASGANKRRADGLQPQIIVKRRASRACLICRRRKVRCDVTSRGAPCTNCRLDDVTCRLIDHNRGARARLSADVNEGRQQIIVVPAVGSISHTVEGKLVPTSNCSVRAIEAFHKMQCVRINIDSRHRKLTYTKGSHQSKRRRKLRTNPCTGARRNHFPQELDQQSNSHNQVSFSRVGRFTRAASAFLYPLFASALEAYRLGVSGQKRSLDHAR